jgi:hypothetical protein
MSRGFDTTFYIAVAMCSVGLLGLAVTEFLPDASTVLTRATFAYWGLVAIFLALVVTGFIWLLALRARLRQHIAGR